jgi:hippurate hydrolase
VTGRGGHAARPHETIDPVATGVTLASALQTIVSRNLDPVDAAVVSVTRFHAGGPYNVIADSAEVSGTVRALNGDVRDRIETRIREIATGVAFAYGATATVDYDRNYPVTRNDPGATEFAADVAAEVVGEANVQRDTRPFLGGEDFSYMLEQRPGALVFLGNGDSAALHSPRYDFNDEIIPVGCSYWARLVETAMPARKG